jgi:hypothetical protein
MISPKKVLFASIAVNLWKSMGFKASLGNDVITNGHGACPKSMLDNHSPYHPIFLSGKGADHHGDLQFPS